MLYREDILNCIKNILYESMDKPIDIYNARYHHNTSYDKVCSIIKHGILSLELLNHLGINNYTMKKLELMDNIESHVNGKNGISLSALDLTDISSNEYIYNPLKEEYVDLLIDNSVMAYRNSMHYGNEFIVNDIISPKMIKSIDIRLLKYMDIYADILKIIDRYNYLIDIAICLKECNLDIPIREMSYDNFVLDVNELVKIPKLTLKL